MEVGPMSRSWGRAHLRWLLREPPARPLPGAALSRLTAAEVAGRSGREAESRGHTDLETGRRGAPRTAPRPGPRAPRPPPRARTGGQVSRQRRARSRRPRGRPSRRLSLCRRIADAQQVGYVTALARSPLRPVLSGLRAAPRPCRRTRQGAGERGGVLGPGGGGGSGGGAEGGLLQLSAPAAAWGGGDRGQRSALTPL